MYSGKYDTGTGIYSTCVRRDLQRGRFDVHDDDDQCRQRLQPIPELGWTGLDWTAQLLNCSTDCSTAQLLNRPMRGIRSGTFDVEPPPLGTTACQSETLPETTRARKMRERRERQPAWRTLIYVRYVAFEGLPAR